MRSSKQQPLQPGPHLLGLWAGLGGYLMLRQAQERMLLGQAMEAGGGEGGEGLSLWIGGVLRVRGGHL